MVRARALLDARARRAGDAGDVNDLAVEPARASGNSASSIVVAKQPGDATYFAALISARRSSGKPYTNVPSSSGCGCFAP
jgi:hypothetical protein